MNNFHPFEVVGRDSETQLQIGDNLNYLNCGFLKWRLKMKDLFVTLKSFILCFSTSTIL